MTSLMTSPDHKECQILKYLYLHQYFSQSVDQTQKISYAHGSSILQVYSTSGITSGKKFAASKWQPFDNFEISNTPSI